MTDADIILIIVTCLVGIVCITAVQIKKGLIMGSILSQLSESSTKKYVERKEKVVLHIPRYSIRYYHSGCTVVYEKFRVNDHLCYFEPIIYKVLSKLFSFA